MPSRGKPAPILSRPALPLTLPPCDRHGLPGYFQLVQTGLGIARSAYALLAIETEPEANSFHAACLVVYAGSVMFWGPSATGGAAPGTATGLALGLALGSTLAWFEQHRAIHEVSEA